MAVVHVVLTATIIHAILTEHVYNVNMENTETFVISFVALSVRTRIATKMETVYHVSVDDMALLVIIIVQLL